jgi:single-strand DNA-binding protein
MNILIVSGNLTAEPDVKVINGSDSNVMSFTVANNDNSKKNQQGGYDKVASFISCEFWTKNPNYWLSVMFKGTGVSVQGMLIQDTWQDEEGKTKSRLKLRVAGYPLILSGKKEKESNKPPVDTSPKLPNSIKDTGGPETFGDDEEIPF